MDCIIKVIKGPDEGQEFKSSGTEMIVGRSPRSQVRLSSPSISYEHAVITRNGDDFFIENLSAAGTFINEERITGKVRLRTRDRLRFGDETVARVAALPAGGTASSRRRILVWAVLAMVVVLLIVVFANGFSAKPKALNRAVAYDKLEPWMQEEVGARRLPPEALALFHQAWRLETAGDRRESASFWYKLDVLLAAQEDKLGYAALAAHAPTLLSRLAANDPKTPPLTDDEMGAALVEFVGHMAHGTR